LFSFILPKTPPTIVSNEKSRSGITYVIKMRIPNNKLELKIQR
jgi:hypothetical protein